MTNTLSRIAILLLLSFPVYLAAEGAAPKAEIDRTSLDFGSVPRGTVLSESFTIGNLGSAALELQGLEFSVYGMRARVKQSIPPGESADLVVTWDTSQYSGKASGQARIQLNDPARPQIVLTLTGTIVSPIEIKPVPAVYLSQFQNESASQSLLISNNQDHDISIKGFELSSDKYSAEISTVEPGRVFRLSVTAKPGAPIGRWRERLYINTDDPKRKRLGIEVNILVKPDVFISLDSIDFGEVALSQIQNNPDILEYYYQTFTINRKVGDMTITDADVSINFLEVTVEPEGPSSTFKVEVGLKPEQLKVGRFDGSLTLKTNDPENPKLVITVTGIITD